MSAPSATSAISKATSQDTINPIRATTKNTIAMEILHTFKLTGKDVYAQTQELSALIEGSCYNEALEIARITGILADFSSRDFIGIYSQQCYKILANLPVISINKSLRNDLSNIAKYSSEELNPKVGEAVRNDIEIRRKQVLVKKVSRAHTCARCGKNETTRTNFQSAAGDEDSTVSIECCACGHKWFK